MWRLIAACVTGVIALLIFGLVISAVSTVGPNEELRTEPVQVGDGARALVLDEAIVPFAQTTVTLHVESDEPVFVGAANGVDTESYLTGVAQEEITSLDFEGPIEHRAIPGEANLPAPPEDLDWWQSSETGESVSYTFDLDADPQTVVVAPVDPEGTLDVSVEAELRATGVFGLSLAGASLGLLFLGLALYFGLSWWLGRLRPRPKRQLTKKEAAEWRESGRERRAQIAAAEAAAPTRGSRRSRRDDTDLDDDEDGTDTLGAGPNDDGSQNDEAGPRDDGGPSDGAGPNDDGDASPARAQATPERPRTAPRVPGENPSTASSPSEVPQKPQTEPFPTRRSRKNSHV